jgi:nicotinamide-nucleotide amidase
VEVVVSAFEADVLALVDAIGEALRARGEKLVSAESCTGGLIAAACTSVAGSSDWFERGFVTYSNEAKNECLGVPATTLQRHGAVSEAVARAMAEGARRVLDADLGIGTTGVAGPEPHDGAAVGTVWIAVAGPDRTLARSLQLSGDRTLIRSQTVAACWDLLDELLADASASVDGRE